LKAIQPAVNAADEYGVDISGAALNEVDRRAIVSLFESFKEKYYEREYIEMFADRLPEIVLGALVAKAQMKAQIEGEFPSPNSIAGPVPIEAFHVGVGEDWEDGFDAAAFTTGAAVNWIHSGTPYMGGTDNYAVKVGENMVVVVLGFGTLHTSPKINAVQFTIDGKLKPPQRMGAVLKISQRKYKRFPKAMLWKKDTTVLGNTFAATAFGATTTDFPYLIGVSYIKEPAYRLLDVASFDGTSYDCIKTTS
jgi:hypothetical protein